MHEKKYKAILVGVEKQHQHDFEYAMEELRNLAEACHIEVAGELHQKAEQAHRAHYVGSGKVEEITALLNATEAEVVICNDELSPSQIRNLEAALACTVIDRTVLILDIFAERAQTREAQLQVEVARLQYMLPRLVGLRASLSRQGGGAGLRNRGAGETKLELDRRRIEDRIAMLQQDLEKLVAVRQVQRKQRRKNEMPVVCLVGYTNTGKSSLMNAFIEKFDDAATKQVFVKDMLFATLETSVRRIELPDKKNFLLTDTVGFVSRLPHHLIKAFRSTLEEVTEADLLVHVVDYSHQNYEQLISVTEQTLNELDAGQIPVIYAFNKCDLTDKPYPRIQDSTVYMSVHEQAGLDELLQLISEQIFKDYKTYDLLIPYEQGKLIAYFNENANILQTNYEENGTRLLVECQTAYLERVRENVTIL
ncbi:GTPase HflX [Paenibacillus yanchengensis]|uniref:GTPase HflX n=1 Tax=Paenibacillus yanchengensis TaxID=2035833 RepID=A0ABW4YGA5_9BACL